MKTCLNLFVFMLLGAGAFAQSAANDDSTIEQYRNQLAQQPDNSDVISRLAQKLEQQGRWRDAMPLLERLIAFEPRNSAALYQLGSMKSWEPAERKKALDLLRRACATSNNNPEYCSSYAEVLSWSIENRAEAISTFQQIVSAYPDNVSARLRLAQILSWDNASRGSALKVYEQGLQLDPRNVDLLIASAEVLSWSNNTRTEALARYNQALQQKPEDPRALNGKAQLLAWEGNADEAMQLYQQVLDKDTQNPAALRGKAEILNWRAHYSEAQSLAEAAHQAAPDDNRARLELARADIGLKKYAAARTAIADVQGNPGPGFNETRQEIHRGMGTWVDFGYADRREHDLAYDRFALTLSTPLAPGHRLTFSYQPTLFDSGIQGFNTNYFSAAVDSEPSDKLATHFQFGADTINNAPVNFDGGMDLRYKPVSSTVLKFAFLRQPVDESLLSRRGVDLAPFSTFQGQVRSNLGSAGVSYYNSAHKYDLSVDYTDGVYTGENLDSNRRYSVEGQIGQALHSDRPYIRLAYGVNYTSFDHDADIQNGVIVPGFSGGYFSPTRYLLNQGIVNFSHRFSKNLNLEATGTAGVQNVETSTASFKNSQFASSFSTHLFWRVTPMNELKFGYDYLNVFNAFNRHLYEFTWRHYF
jgi:tetratricopeptide (TPR) repeat protein